MNAGLDAARASLAGVPGFAFAEVQSGLSDGPTNSSWLISRGAERFVLRLDKPAAARLGLDRANERVVCEAVAAAGLAPKPLYFDLQAGIYLRRWQPGRAWRPEDLHQPAKLALLAAALRRLHSLPAVGKNFEPGAALRRYADQLGTEESAALAKRAASLLAELDRTHPERCLCHNDLVSGNIISVRAGRAKENGSEENGSEGEPCLIDWEYAACGDPLFDLAVVARHHRLDAAQQSFFLTAYRDGAVGAGDEKRLRQQCAFYQCLLDLWNLRVAPSKRRRFGFT